MKTHINKIKVLLTLLLVGLVTQGCKKFADVPSPSYQLTSATVFTNDNTVLTTLSGMFSTFYISSYQYTQIDMTVCPDNSADDCSYYTANSTYDPYLLNAIPSNEGEVQGIWTALYQVIYQANVIIEGVTKNTSVLKATTVSDALGQAKFMRAYCYYYLTNLFGDVPLPITSSAITNAFLPRSAQSVVYSQIIQDLTDAQNLLRSDYSASSAGDRVIPNKYAASALLARVYLYTKNYQQAESLATTVINQPSLYNLLATSAIANVFLKNSNEAIFQMNGATNGSNNSLGYTQLGFYYASAPIVSSSPTPSMSITASLINEFEANDKRYANWITSMTYKLDGKTYYVPYKYKQTKVNTTAAAEGYMILRLAEQYLIRAEARAQQNNVSGSQADLNRIRNRAGLANTLASTSSDLLLAIEHERRCELFCENGHRWFDLKRTDRANTVLAGKSGWRSTAQLYPMPYNELLNDVNLKQNPGY